MYDTEALAIRVANRAREMLRIYRIVDIEDNLITNLASAGAIREAGRIFRDINRSNDDVELLVGTSESEGNVSLTFNEIASILCGDDVLNRSIEILKVMSQNRWRSYQHILGDQSQNQFRENYIQRSTQRNTDTVE